MTLTRGMKVKVVRGRKVPKGTVAEVFWFGADKFKANAYRVGLALPNGTKVFTDAGNVEPVNAEVVPVKVAEVVAPKPSGGDYDGTLDYNEAVSRDTGRYSGGYRTYKNGTEREDFLSDF